jgi:phosphomevalonate kinase
MKLMGILSGVPIEPDAQTIILDKCLSIPNVIAAFVPGAGGNDAIYCIGIGSDSHDQLLHMWSHEKCLYPLIGDVTQTGFRVENINF